MNHAEKAANPGGLPWTPPGESEEGFAMVLNPFRQTKGKTIHFYCFWKQQYMDRNSGKSSDGDSTKFIANISRGYEPEGRILDWNKLALHSLDKCKFVEADDSTVTIRIARDADDATILNAVRVWRCLTPVKCGGEGYTVHGPYIFSALFDVAQHSIAINHYAAFNPNQWASRAIGLWLWDYVNDNGGRVITAIRAMKKQLGPEIDALGFADSEENVFRRFYRKTRECIDACEVISFK